jgi:siroheme synthase-like protein
MKEKETNNLFPVFLKLEMMSVLIVGGGKVGLEKLQAILTNAPATRIRLVAIDICKEIRQLSDKHATLSLFQKSFAPADVEGADIVFIAIDDKEESSRIRNMAKAAGKLVNVADRPESCDFYMSSIVQKGNLKIAISTNGKSPTIAKRLKEIFQELLPEELDQLLENMHRLRNGLGGNFQHKVDELNKLTSSLSSKDPL